MITKLKTAPTIEPISVTEAKEHLRIDSEDFADDITPTQSIAPGSHAVAASYTLKGSGVSVSGYNVLVHFNVGDCSGGTVDVKIQESDTDDDAEYTDVADGAFDQVDTDNDNAVYEKAYTGNKAYIRVVATVATAACEFGVTIIKDSPVAADESYITALVTAARRHAENYMGRKLITQTWYGYLNAFPNIDSIELPFGNLQSVTALKYTDTDESESTFSSDYYSVDTASWKGRIVLNYGRSWPGVALWPMNPIEIEFICGYGDNRSDVPEDIKDAIKMILHDLYVNREAQFTGAYELRENKAVMNLLNQYSISYL